MRFGLGLVIGKFYPPHRGHKLLIDTALQQSERTVVIVCERTTDTIPGKLRQSWLQEIHPGVEVMLIDDHYDEQDSRVWAENTIGWPDYSLRSVSRTIGPFEVRRPVMFQSSIRIFGLIPLET